MLACLKGPARGKNTLEAKIKALYESEVSDDWKTWYEMTSPEIRRECSFKEFKKDLGQREYKILSWKIMSIRNVEHPKDTPKNIQAAAAVAMDVVTEYPDGKREKATDQTDYWVLINNQWYWSWRGWPHD